MKEEEIAQDRHDRAVKAEKEINEILNKYELALVAEEKIGGITVNILIQFRDNKKHDGQLAQPESVVPPKEIQDILEGKGDELK